MQYPEVNDGPEGKQLPLGELVQGVSEERYGQDEGLRSTELKYAARSAAHWQAYLTAPRRDTEEMAFGRLVHMAILEPDRFRQWAHEQPDFGDLRSPANRKTAAEWKAGLRPGAEVYTAEQAEALRGIYRRVTGHSRARHMLEDAQREVAFAWEDQGTGLRCKARLDLLTAEGFAVDVKTTRDASFEAFSKEVVNREYTLSAAHYLEGLRQTGLGVPDRFFFIACEKVPPYELAVYSLPTAALRRGRFWQRHALANVQRARADGVFEGYPEIVQTLDEPGYAPLPPGVNRTQLYEE